jgi:lipid-binding SYLF domain-containing protein
MKKLIILTLAICFLAVASYSETFAGWDPAKAEQERKAAAETIAKFKEKDPSMERFFDSAYGYAVFPTVGTGALIVGAAHGKGLVYKNIWISGVMHPYQAKGKIVGRSSLSQGTVGLQAGGQAYSEIIFFKDKAAFDSLKDGKLKLARQASAIAVTAGASADADYDSGVAVFTMGKGGLMLQAAIGGQQLTFEPKSK